MAKRATDEITKREAETAAYLLFGYSNKEIGERLFIGVSAVKFNAYCLYRKLGYEATLAKSSRYKFMGDYLMGRIPEEKLWLVNRYLSELAIKQQTEKAPSITLLKGHGIDPLPRGKHE